MEEFSAAFEKLIGSKIKKLRLQSFFGEKQKKNRISRMQQRFY